MSDLDDTLDTLHRERQLSMTALLAQVESVIDEVIPLLLDHSYMEMASRCQMVRYIIQHVEIVERSEHG